MKPRRKPPPVPVSPEPHFTPFAAAQRAALDTLIQQTVSAVFRTIAQEGYADLGRGLVVWTSPTGTFRGLRPPSYVALTTWQRNPLLINTPHADLRHAIETYDPHAAYVVLCMVSAADAPAYGQYGWWAITETQATTRP